VAAVEADLPALKAQVEASKQLLIALAGGDDAVTAIDWQQTAVPELQKPVSLQASADFLSKRPDVRQSERRLAAATANIGVVTADLYPSLSLSGFLGVFSTQGAVLTGDAKAWSIAPSMSWQALDLDSVRARIRAADAQQQASLASFENTLLNAIAETRTSLSNYTQLQQRLASLETQVKANQEALELARYQYKNGAIALLDLLDVERQWLSARDQRVQAQAQVSSALVDIYQALGGGILAQS